MWDAVRNIFRHDEKREEQQAPPETEHASPSGQPARTAEGNPAMAPLPPDAEAGRGTVEVSPPGHAPQGLAAEAGVPAQPEEGTPLETDAAPDVGHNDIPAAPGPAPSTPMDIIPPTGNPPLPEQPVTETTETRPQVPEEQGTGTTTGQETPSASMQPPTSPSDATALLTPDTSGPLEIPTEALAATTHTTLERPEAALAATSAAAEEALQAATTSESAPSGTEMPTAEAAGPAAAGGEAEAPADTTAAPIEAQTEAAPSETPAAPETASAGTEIAGAAPTEAATGAPVTDVAETPPVATDAAQALPEEITSAEAPAAAEPLAPGTVVGERYTITGPAELPPGAGGVRAYQATDSQSYAHCWSCGSTGNAPSSRFCQNCGAPIQNHPVTLIETTVPTDTPGEVEHDGAWFHVQPQRRRFGAEGIGIEIGAYSAEGPHHPNEDSYWFSVQTLCANSGRQSMAVAVFADGMGGYAPGSGLISSRIAATIGTSVMSALAGRDGQAVGEDDVAGIMREAIAAANTLVLQEIAQKGEMGATAVALLVYGETAYLANVGDSRAYYIDPQGKATAITRDQSLVAQEMEQGHLTEQDIYTAPGNNIILHAIGEPNVEQAADLYTQPLEPGSLLMLCSDGYWKTMRGAIMPENVRRESATLNDLAHYMVDTALAHGSDDNTTVVLVAIS